MVRKSIFLESLISGDKLDKSWQVIELYLWDLYSEDQSQKVTESDATMYTRKGACKGLGKLAGPKWPKLQNFIILLGATKTNIVMTLNIVFNYPKTTNPLKYYLK